MTFRRLWISYFAVSLKFHAHLARKLVSQANELLCRLPDLDTNLHSFRLPLWVHSSQRERPKCLQHPRRPRFRCATLLGIFFLNSALVPLKYTDFTDGFLVSKCKGSSHAQSIHLSLTLLLCWDSLLLLLAIPATASSTVPRLCVSPGLQAGWGWQTSGKRKCVNKLLKF